MRKQILLILGIIFLVSVQLVSAEIKISIDIKDSLIEQENINFDYSLNSDSDVQLKFFPHIECPSAPVAPIEEKTINLKKNVPYKDVYSGGVVKDFFEPQTCKAYVRILSPFEQTFSKDFEIITSPSFSFETKTCKDSECSEITKVFVKDESVYLDYASSVENPSVTAVLTYPDKTAKQLTLPTFIKAYQIGNYELEIMASKQNYKTTTKKELFGVIEGNVIIKPKEFKGDKYASYLLYFLIIALLVALVYITRKIGGIPDLGIKTRNSDVIRINNRINNAKRLVIRGNVNAAISEYLEITKLYDKLIPEKKKVVYKNLHDLYIRVK